MSDSQQRRRPHSRPESDHGSSSSRRRSTRPHPNARRGRKRRRRGTGKKISKILIVLVVLVGFAVAGAGLGTVFGILQSTDMLNTSDVMPQSYTSIVYDDAGTEVDKLHGKENREYVNLDEIPLHMQHAVVAIEDERFYEHGGIDMRGIFRALVENIKTIDRKSVV